MKYAIVGILPMIITFGAVIFVFFSKKSVGGSVRTSAETAVRSSTEISESNTVPSAVTTESSAEIMSASNGES